MSEGSNTAARIAELRRRIASSKGKYDRATFTIGELEWKRRQCLQSIRLDQAEIKSMGGKVRR